jgi:hypothetical protein
MDPVKVQILAIVENQYFDQLFLSMKQDIANKMVEVDDVAEIVKLRDEVRALDRLQGKLTEIANDVRMSR